MRIPDSSDSSLRVVIDCSVIGLAQLFETARTGIYRVISNLSRELLSRDEGPDIRYSSLSSIQVNQLTDIFFRELCLEAKEFEKSRLERLIIRLAGSSREARQESLVRKVLSRLYRIAHASRITRKTDIYHSMYAALPRFGANKPVRMMTIYDIIPLIHPEYFAEGFADEFRPIVESFSPERDFVFTISECTKRDICSYFHMDPERIFVTPLAASDELYSPVSDMSRISKVKEMFNLPQGRYFLTLATVEKRKNLAASIRCFRRILHEPEGRDLGFVLVGTRGWKVKEIIDEIEADPLLRQRVVFTGFIPDQYLSAVYSGAEAFLYPSLYEGFGLPPLEAMQCGVPVITSNTSSLPEVVGDAGILVDPHDDDQITEAMLKLLRSSSLRQGYREKGLRRAASFSWKKCADLTLDGYRKAWDGRE